MTFLRALARFFVFRNVWIAVCAVSMLEETRWFFGEHVYIDALSVFIFFATFFEYNLHSFGGKLNPLQPWSIAKYLAVSNIKPILRTCVIIGFLGALVSFFFLSKNVMITTILLAMFTISYTVPLIKKREKFVRLREITYLKIFTVAFVWSFLTVIVPMLDFTNPISVTEAIIIFLRRFLFIYAITIPFEIRDMERERLYGNISLPMIYGIKKMVYGN